MEHGERDRFVAAAGIAADLIRRREVTERWSDESACAGMSIGGLAFHLGAQTDLAVRLLRADPSDLAPISLAEHYARAAWVRSGPEDEANTEIRDGSEAQAQAGPQALATMVESALRALPSLLSAVDPGVPVLVPWQGWALTAHDLLVTRLMETVVHADDLAASVGVATPDFPDAVVTPVLDLLTGLAVRRHGATALVRTLARPQRAPASVAAF